MNLVSCLRPCHCGISLWLTCLSEPEIWIVCLFTVCLQRGAEHCRGNLDVHDVTTLTRAWSRVSPGCSDLLIKASASLNHSTNHAWVCCVAGTLWGTGAQLCPVQRRRRALSYFPQWLVHVFATIFKTKLSKFVVFLLSLRRFLERIPSFLIFQSLFFVFPSLSHH